MKFIPAEPNTGITYISGGMFYVPEAGGGVPAAALDLEQGGNLDLEQGGSLEVESP